MLDRGICHHTRYLHTCYMRRPSHSTAEGGAGIDHGRPCARRDQNDDDTRMGEVHGIAAEADYGDGGLMG